MTTPAEEIRAAVIKLGCDHRFPVNPFVDKCERCGCKWDGRADVPAWLGEPLADLLALLADDMDDRKAVEGAASKAVHPVHFMLGIDAPRADWTAALATARAISGGGS